MKTLNPANSITFLVCCSQQVPRKLWKSRKTDTITSTSHQQKSYLKPLKISVVISVDSRGMPNSWKKNADKGDISPAERRGGSSRKRNKPKGCSCCTEWSVDLAGKKGKGEMKRREKYDPYYEENDSIQSSRAAPMYCSVISAPPNGSEKHLRNSLDSGKQVLKLGLYVDQFLSLQPAPIPASLNESFHSIIGSSTRHEYKDSTVSCLNIDEFAENTNDDVDDLCWEIISISDTSRESSPFERIELPNEGDDLKGEVKN